MDTLKNNWNQFEEEMKLLEEVAVFIEWDSKRGILENPIKQQLESSFQSPVVNCTNSIANRKNLSNP